MRSHLMQLTDTQAFNICVKVYRHEHQVSPGGGEVAHMATVLRNL